MKFKQGDVIKTKNGQHEFYVESVRESSVFKGSIEGKIILGSTGDTWVSEHDVMKVTSQTK